LASPFNHVETPQSNSNLCVYTPSKELSELANFTLTILESFAILLQVSQMSFTLKQKHTVS